MRIRSLVATLLSAAGFAATSASTTQAKKSIVIGDISREASRAISQVLMRLDLKALSSKFYANLHEENALNHQDIVFLHSNGMEKQSRRRDDNPESIYMLNYRGRNMNKNY